MSRETTLMLLGVLIVIAPFVGLPLSVLSFVLPVLGFCVALVGILMRIARPSEPRATPHESEEPQLS